MSPGRGPPFVAHAATRCCTQAGGLPCARLAGVAARRARKHSPCQREMDHWDHCGWRAGVREDGGGVGRRGGNARVAHGGGGCSLRQGPLPRPPPMTGTKEAHDRCVQATAAADRPDGRRSAGKRRHPRRPLPHPGTWCAWQGAQVSSQEARPTGCRRPAVSLSTGVARDRSRRGGASKAKTEAATRATGGSGRGTPLARTRVSGLDRHWPGRGEGAVRVAGRAATGRARGGVTLPPRHVRGLPGVDAAAAPRRHAGPTVGGPACDGQPAAIHRASASL